MSSLSLFYNYSNDPLRIIKIYFNSRNNNYFVENLEALVAREGGGNPCGCTFPEGLDEYDDKDTETFEGVCCWYFEEEIIVSEQEFYNIMIMACDAYIEINPTKKEDINRVLRQWKFSNY
jgi:CDI immunity protein